MPNIFTIILAVLASVYWRGRCIDADEAGKGQLVGSTEEVWGFSEREILCILV